MFRSEEQIQQNVTSRSERVCMRLFLLLKLRKAIIWSC